MEQNPYQSPQTAVPGAASVYTKPSMKELLFSFTGRVPRRVFWGVSLISALVFSVIAGIAMAIDPTFGMIVVIAMYIPLIWISLAVSIKRWHDRGKSGWWIFIGLIPFVGGIWAFVECGCLRGTIGDNVYGAEPT
ncbi:MAG: uncharacterized membrane protein YhaH (DUF805 family) [Verrucomicrobiales bacterium]|jgi:uncharacterized membrane protein YhaH (DUF805 family)